MENCLQCGPWLISFWNVDGERPPYKTNDYCSIILSCLPVVEETSQSHPLLLSPGENILKIERIEENNEDDFRHANDARQVYLGPLCGRGQ
jgi:hypothetical protein